MKKRSKLADNAVIRTTAYLPGRVHLAVSMMATTHRIKGNSDLNTQGKIINQAVVEYLNRHDPEWEGSV